MIRYILVDDNESVLSSVKSKIDKLPKDYQLMHVQSYYSSKQAFESINEDDFDLLIVDFEMPVYNGIELAKRVASNKKVIFLTSTTNNAPKMMNALSVSGYLSKPFEIDEFEEVLKNKVIGKIKTSSNTDKNLITLHIGSNKDVRFKTEQVYYISTSKNINGKQPDKNCVHIYGKNDEILYRNVRKSISELTLELANYNFKKISQSTIINMEHVKERDNTIIGLFNCSETFVVTAKEKISFVAKLRAKFRNW